MFYRNLKRFFSAKGVASACPADSNGVIKMMDDLPGAREFPVVGTLLDFILYKGGFSRARLYLPHERVRRFGKIYYERFGPSSRHVQVADPVAIELVLREEDAYPRRTKNRLLEYFWKAHNRKPGVFFSDGPEWYKHRHALGKRMLLPRAIAQYTPTMNEISSDFIARLKSLRAPGEESDTSFEVNDFDAELFKWSFESVGFVIFGKRLGAIRTGTDPKVNEFITSTGDFLKHFLPTAYIPTKVFDYYHTEGYKQIEASYSKMYELGEFFIIQRCREFQKLSANDSATSLLQYLYFEENLSQDELLYSFIDLLFAGVDTTANTMQWVLYELAKNPDKQAVLFAEITSALPELTRSHSDNSSSIQVTSEDLKKLPYLRAVVQETLRLYPVLPHLQRTLPKDVVLSGYKVPAFTLLHLMSQVTARDPKVFVEPESFEPERWLKSSQNESCGFNKFASLPFGFGRRMCIGRRVAELELHVLLFHVVLNFHLAYPENEIVKPIARGTLIPEKPVRVKFFDRKSAQ